MSEIQIRPVGWNGKQRSGQQRARMRSGVILRVDGSREWVSNGINTRACEIISEASKRALSTVKSAVVYVDREDGKTEVRFKQYMILLQYSEMLD